MSLPRRRPTIPARVSILVLAALVLAGACGSGGATNATTSGAGAGDGAAATAAQNIDGLQGSDDVRLIEVLDVADGSVTTLDGAVDGDRPVLLWFWAPH